MGTLLPKPECAACACLDDVPWSEVEVTRDRSMVPELILVSDPGQDLDDEMALITLRNLVHKGLAQLRGIIVTLAPVFDRARLCRGTLDTLGLDGVPVAMGTAGSDADGYSDGFHSWAQSYMPRKHCERSSFESAFHLLSRLYRNAPSKTFTLVITAGMKDAAIFLRDNQDLFIAKTREVVIMGAVQPWGATVPAVLVPDAAHTSTMETEASQFFYRRCQELGVPLIVVSKWAAAAAQVPRSCYDEIAELGSSIGCRLRNAQRTSMDALWSRACAPPGSAERQGLPEHCDRRWFMTEFCRGNEDSERQGADTIWDLIVSFKQYDSVTMLAAVPELRNKFFSPSEVHGQERIIHNVIGHTEAEHNVVDQEGISEFLHYGFVMGISLNHHRRAEFILLAQPSWTNGSDLMLTCVLLRSLYELDMVDCTGIIVSPGPATGIKQPPKPARRYLGSALPLAKAASYGEYVIDLEPREEGTEFPMIGRNSSEPDGPAMVHVPTIKRAQDLTNQRAQGLRSILDDLGLAHVPLLVADMYGGHGMAMASTATDHLKSLYDVAPPAGVTLVVTACAGDVAAFAKEHSKDFTHKTRNVILFGGAWITAGNTLEPDPYAMNNALDMASAIELYRMAQEMLVPMTVVSRHCVQACQLPRHLFDVLGSHGGEIGNKLCMEQRSSIDEFWDAACAPVEDTLRRRGLPMWCDREWFIGAFCGGCPIPDDDDDIWPNITCLNMYSPLVLLGVLPGLFERVTKAACVNVRSVTHRVVGLSSDDTGVEDAQLLRCLLYQCLFMGARLNASEFTLDEQAEKASEMPAITVDPSSNDAWRFDPSADAFLTLLTGKGLAQGSKLSCI